MKLPAVETFHETSLQLFNHETSLQVKTLVGQDARPTRVTAFLWGGQESLPHKSYSFLVGWAGEPAPQELQLSCGVGRRACPILK